MAEFRTVARLSEVPVNTAKVVRHGMKMVALFNREGTIFAIEDTCPHMGASLAEGTVHDGVVACPWHAWRFRLADGTWVDSPKLKVPCYPVRIVGDDIQIEI